MTWYSEKMMISYNCMRGFMPNSHKKSWIVSIAYVEIDSRKDLPEVGTVEERKSKSSVTVKFKWVPLQYSNTSLYYLNQFVVIVCGKNMAHRYLRCPQYQCIKTLANFWAMINSKRKKLGPFFKKNLKNEQSTSH